MLGNKIVNFSPISFIKNFYNYPDKLVLLSLTNTTSPVNNTCPLTYNLSLNGSCMKAINILPMSPMKQKIKYPNPFAIINSTNFTNVLPPANNTSTLPPPIIYTKS